MDKVRIVVDVNPLIGDMAQKWKHETTTAELDLSTSTTVSNRSAADSCKVRAALYSAVGDGDDRTRSLEQFARDSDGSRSWGWTTGRSPPAWDATAATSAVRNGGSVVQIRETSCSQGSFPRLQGDGTKFARPTIFSRRRHRPQEPARDAGGPRGSTAIRYLYEEATKRGMFENQLGEIKRWTQPELEEVRPCAGTGLESNRWASRRGSMKSRSVTLPRQ